MPGADHQARSGKEVVCCELHRSAVNRVWPCTVVPKAWYSCSSASLSIFRRNAPFAISVFPETLRGYFIRMILQVPSQRKQPGSCKWGLHLSGGISIRGSNREVCNHPLSSDDVPTFPFPPQNPRRPSATICLVNQEMCRDRILPRRQTVSHVAQHSRDRRSW